MFNAIDRENHFGRLCLYYMEWSAQSSGILKLEVKNREAHLPFYLKELLELARSLKVNFKRVWLFGSRAKGLPRSNSDFDIAFELSSKANWQKFLSQIAENPISVYKMDVLDLEDVSEGFKKSIIVEGVLIYESGK